jgi:hypothetical protein
VVVVVVVEESCAHVEQELTKINLSTSAILSKKNATWTVLRLNRSPFSRGTSTHLHYDTLRSLPISEKKLQNWTEDILCLQKLSVPLLHFLARVHVIIRSVSVLALQTISNGSAKKFLCPF